MHTDPGMCFATQSASLAHVATHCLTVLTSTSKHSSSGRCKRVQSLSTLHPPWVQMEFTQVQLSGNGPSGQLLPGWSGFTQQSFGSLQGTISSHGSGSGSTPTVPPPLPLPPPVVGPVVTLVLDALELAPELETPELAPELDEPAEIVAVVKATSSEHAGAAALARANWIMKTACASLAAAIRLGKCIREILLCFRKPLCLPRPSCSASRSRLPQVEGGCSGSERAQEAWGLHSG